MPTVKSHTRYHNEKSYEALIVTHLWKIGKELPVLLCTLVDTTRAGEVFLQGVCCPAAGPDRSSGDRVTQGITRSLAVQTDCYRCVFRNPSMRSQASLLASAL
jgi:hypothetical protein